MLKNTENTYGTIAKFFHWGMFLLIAGLLVVGFIMSDMESSPDKFKLYGLHKAIGISVLMLVVLRLAWRLKNTVPTLPAHLKSIEKTLAHLAHYALYALMFAMPISGWLMSSAAGFPVSFFGLFTLPNLMPASNEWKVFLIETHTLLALALIILVVLHVVAALMHHFYHKDNVLKRMLPWR